MTICYDEITYSYVTNLQGDVVAIVNSAGAVMVEYSYDAWGNVLSITGSMADTMGEMNPLRYRGYVYDHETGLYYLQSRYYDPELGRFISADAFASTGQGMLGNNMFAYCNNNPTSCSDLLGFRPVSILDRFNAVSMPVLARKGKEQTSEKRDVTQEVCDSLSKAAERARTYRAVSDFVLGDNICSDGAVCVEFYELVNHNKPWDIKRPEQWEATIGTPFPGFNVEVVFCDVVMTPENLGNFTYGYLGYAYGIPRELLIPGSYYAAGFPTGGNELENEIKDWCYILYGYEVAKEVYGMG